MTMPKKKAAKVTAKKPVKRSAGTAVKKTAVSKAIPPPAKGSASPGGY